MVLSIYYGILEHTLNNAMNSVLETSKKLRKSKPSELQEIVALASKTFDTFYRPFLGDHNVDWYVGSGELKREIVKHANDLHVLLINNEIKGFAIYFDDFIHIMMIDEDAHRLGMGSFLMTAVEDQLFKNHNNIKLQSFVGNKIATSFYLKNGWKKGAVNNARKDVAMMYFEKEKS